MYDLDHSLSARSSVKVKALIHVETHPVRFQTPRKSGESSAITGHIFRNGNTGIIILKSTYIDRDFEDIINSVETQYYRLELKNSVMVMN